MARTTLLWELRERELQLVSQVCLTVITKCEATVGLSATG